MGETAARKNRSVLIHKLIAESPYREGLKCYQEDIIRVAESHPQIVQSLDTLQELQFEPSINFRFNETVCTSLKIINDFFEFIYFSTPETYRIVSGGK